MEAAPLGDSPRKFNLRVKCGPAGRTGREEEWTGDVRVDQSGKTRIDGMTNGPDGKYIRVDADMKPREVRSRIADIADQCSR